MARLVTSQGSISLGAVEADGTGGALGRQSGPHKDINWNFDQFLVMSAISHDHARPIHRRVEPSHDDFYIVLLLGTGAATSTKLASSRGLPRLRKSSRSAT